MTDQHQQADQEVEDPERDADPEPAADIDESDHADGADIFGEVDPDSDLDTGSSEEQQESTSEQEKSSADRRDEQGADDPLGMADPGDDRVTIGEVYCNGVGLAAAAAVGSFGGDDDPRDRKDLMDEYSGLARDLDLDKYVDDALAAHGGPEDLPPAHAAVLMTVVLAVSIGVSEPEATTNLVEAIKSNA